MSSRNFKTTFKIIFIKVLHIESTILPLFCRYKFNCQDPGIETTQELQYNEWQLWVNWISNSWESGNIPFLGYIPVECPENQLLNSFQVKFFSFSSTTGFFYSCSLF
jgi:hypothetical protein